MCRAHPHVRDRKQQKCDGLILISHPRASKNPWTSISICFFSLSVSESLSRNAGCDIECTLLGILKRLRASSRITWRARIRWELSICLDIYLPWFLVGRILGETQTFLLVIIHQLKKKKDDHLRIWVAGTVLEVQGCMYFSLCKSHVFTPYRCQWLLLCNLAKIAAAM